MPAAVAKAAIHQHDKLGSLIAGANGLANGARMGDSDSDSDVEDVSPALPPVSVSQVRLTSEQLMLHNPAYEETEDMESQPTKAVSHTDAGSVDQSPRTSSAVSSAVEASAVPYHLTLAPSTAAAAGYVNEVLELAKDEADEVANLGAQLSKALPEIRGELDFVTTVLQAMVTAEAAYSNAIHSSLQGKRAPTNERLTPLQQLPQAMLDLHRGQCANLSDVLAPLKQLITRNEELNKRYVQDEAATQAKVQAARQAVNKALTALQTAGVQATAVLGSRSPGTSSQAASMVDPWICLRNLLQAFHELREWQDKGHALLVDAIQMTQEMERERAASFSQVAATLYADYSQGPLSVAVAVRKATGLGGSTSLDHGLTSICDQRLTELQGMSEFVKLMRSRHVTRQTKELDQLVAMVRDSPAIIKQAALRHRDTQVLFTAWFPSYAVLTRGGHFFLFKQPTAHQGTTELRGSELLFEFKLCNTALEEGPAPCFSLIKQASGFAWRTQNTKLTFHAETVETCAEWESALKNAIQTWKNTAH